MSYLATKRAYVLRKPILSTDKRQKHTDKCLQWERMWRGDDKGICVQLAT